MITLYDKKIRKRIRNKFSKKVICPNNLQRAHIFGFREAKYIELSLQIIDVEILIDVLTDSRNCICLTSKEHRLFESGKLEINNLTSYQNNLYKMSNQIRKTKYRTIDKKLSLYIFNELKILSKRLT